MSEKPKLKLKTYVVQANLQLQVGIEVTGKDMEEILAKAREFKELDFVDIKGEFLDGDMRLTGMYEIS